MSTHLWRGTADAVAKVASGAIASLDATPANNTFTITIGGVAVSVAGVTDVATTAAALVAAATASTHPFYTALTFAVPSSGNITATANEAGIDFTATLTKTGAGTGTVTAFSTTTANAGPNIWVAENFSTGSLPANGDTVIFENSNVPVLWGLDQSAVTLAELRVMASYTGFIGLPEGKFATSTTPNFNETSVVYSETTKPEYRDCYLKIGATLCNLGQGNGTCSPRLKINFGTVQTVTTVYNGRGTGLDENLQPVRLLGTHADNAYTIYGGSVGWAASTGSEVSTVSTCYALGGLTWLGQGVTWTTIRNSGGIIHVNSPKASTGVINQDVSSSATFIRTSTGSVYSMSIKAGKLVADGVLDVSTGINVYGGTLIYNATGTIANLGLSVNGVADFSQSPNLRTLTLISYDTGTLIYNPAYVSITTPAFSNNGIIKIVATQV